MPRRYRRWPSLPPVILLLILIALLLRGVWDSRSSSDGDPLGDVATLDALPSGAVEVVRVVDGDTLLVRESRPNPSNRPFRVRLLGVDTPETVKENHPVEPWGPEATAFTKQFLARGSVRLEYDKRRVDRYGRVLTYVYAGDEFLNLELVRAGLARIESYPGDSQYMLRRLKDAEREAQADGRGIWSRP